MSKISVKKFPRALGAAVGVVALTFTTVACSLPTSTPPEGLGTDAQFNLADAAAVVAGSAVLAQVPRSNEGGEVDQFIAQLEATKNGNAEGGVATGYNGAVVVNFEMTPQGLDAPICIITNAPPALTPPATQQNWVTYYDPGAGTEENPPAMLLYPGITTCEEARTRLADETAQGRRIATDVFSGNVIRRAYGVVPTSELDGAGLQVFDLVRGFAVNEQAAPAE